MVMLLNWDQGTEKRYESGLDRATLYPRNVNGTYPSGVEWYGVTALTESPGGAEATDLYANNAKYASLMSAETFSGSIEAYTYPEEWNACDGSVEVEDGLFVRQQPRSAFGLSYRTRIGSESGGDVIGFKYHLVYGAKASPSEVSSATVNENTEASPFSWDFTTTPISAGEDYAPSSKLVIDSTKALPAFITWLDAQLYGTAATTEPVAPAVPAVLPLPSVIIAQYAVLAA